MAYLFSGCMGIFSGILFLFAGVAMFTIAEYPGPEESGHLIAQFARVGFSGLFIGCGLLFLIPGVRTFTDLPRRARLLRDLRENGIETTATVTFVDRNFRLKVNGNYIYTIVEYEYVDHHGQKQSHKLPRVPSEIAIRQDIKVGSTINIVYLPDRPEKSGWLELQKYIDASLET